MIKKENIKKRAGALIIAGGIAIGAVGGIKLADRVDNPIYQVCPITKITTKLFGKEAGAKHQINHINSFVGDAASMVDYMDEINLTIYGSSTEDTRRVILPPRITTIYDDGAEEREVNLLFENGMWQNAEEEAPILTK